MARGDGSADEPGTARSRCDGRFDSPDCRVDAPGGASASVPMTSGPSPGPYQPPGLTSPLAMV